MSEGIEYQGEDPSVVVEAEPDPVDTNDVVKMYHPDIVGYAEATRRAFDEVWKPKGWTLVQSEEEEE